MAGPVISKHELKRLPFQRRPVAEPHTALVYQLPGGGLVDPNSGYTAGESWWKSPQAYFVVDVAPHAEAFTAELPCEGDNLYFSASVSYTWRVQNPTAVVRDPVPDPALACRGHLEPRLREVSRRFSAYDSAAAERAIRIELSTLTDSPGGLVIYNVGAELRRDALHRELGTKLEIIKLEQELAEAQAHGTGRIEKINQTNSLALQGVRADFFSKMINGGLPAIFGGMVAQDPAKMGEAMNFIMTMEQQNQELALKAMKVILDGDHLRIGEIDPAVSAVVQRFTTLVSDMGGRFTASPLAGLTTDPAPALSDTAAPATPQPPQQAPAQDSGGTP
jgi:hypothetical protein